MPKIIYVICTDLTGILLIIGSILFGWLPGPGGIPMFLAGLGLLSIHHTWARKLLRYLKTHGTHLQSKLFPNHSVAHWLYDISVAVMLIIAIYIFYRYTGNASTTIGIILVSTGVGIFFSNRQRLQKIMKIFRR